MMFSLRTTLTLVSALSLLGVACTIGETTEEVVTLPFTAKVETRTCESPFSNPDLSTLTPCGNGKGHCYDSTKTAVTSGQLAPCEKAGEVCIPDTILSQNGKKLKSCTFFLESKPGVCMSTLLKDVEAHKGELQPDVCDKENERCTPCINPLDGSDTHVCDEGGVHEKACVGGVGAQAQKCCVGLGICSKPDAVPAEQRGSLPTDVCHDGNICLPAALVGGTPVKCEVLGASGVCIGQCFATQLSTIGRQIRSNCNALEVCLPCAIGKSQGLPGCD